ncbi:uncharacterized protein LOC111698318 isoform X2 [Eurytemora carolleeae]|uniref:uncharacterized protein LOC111698318 isoform X2 n=1 Tax=Eurytemora carolleeae TaxID=1294199 RepID=UPI000C762A38|nr:uncharacterized protein LOC111698318 isoform X2 [Eurytemora carolleeae]|eukprot:XP_023324398.1 uncharacterized protein LOC111698318 isoform X2 [Eurytemora affinis]
MATLRKVTLTHKDGIAGNKIDENPPKRKNVILKPSVIPAEIDPSLESEPKKLKLDIKPLNSKLLTHKNVKLKIPEDKIVPSEDDHLKSSEYVQHVNLTPKIFGNTQGNKQNISGVTERSKHVILQGSNSYRHPEKPLRNHINVKPTQASLLRPWTKFMEKVLDPKPLTVKGSNFTPKSIKPEVPFSTKIKEEPRDEGNEPTPGSQRITKAVTLGSIKLEPREENPTPPVGQVLKEKKRKIPDLVPISAKLNLETSTSSRGNPERAEPEFDEVKLNLFRDRVVNTNKFNIEPPPDKFRRKEQRFIQFIPQPSTLLENSRLDVEDTECEDCGGQVPPDFLSRHYCVKNQELTQQDQMSIILPGVPVIEVLRNNPKLLFQPRHKEIDPDPLSWDEEDELEEEDLERFGQVEVKMETLEDEEVQVKLEEEDEIQLGIEEMTEEFDLESPLQIDELEQQHEDEVEDEIVIESIHEYIMCRICNENIRAGNASVLSHFRRHRPQLNLKGVYPCPYCGKGYNMGHHTERHIETVHCKTKQKCKLCGVRFMNLKAHQEKYHTLKNVDTCEMCGKVVKHLSSHHCPMDSMKTIRERNKMVDCPSCGNNVKEKYLRIHKKNHCVGSRTSTFSNFRTEGKILSLNARNVETSPAISAPNKQNINWKGRNQKLEEDLKPIPSPEDERTKQNESLLVGRYRKILPAPTSKICKLDLKTPTASTVKKSINPGENKINPDISSKLSGHETRKERRGIFILNPR